MYKMHVAAQTVSRIDTDSQPLAYSMLAFRANAIDTTPFELGDSVRYRPVERASECERGCTPSRARDAMTKRLIIPLIFSGGDVRMANKVPRGLLPHIDFAERGFTIAELFERSEESLARDMLDPYGAPFEEYYGRKEFGTVKKIKLRIFVRLSCLLTGRSALTGARHDLLVDSGLTTHGTQCAILIGRRGRIFTL